MAVTAGVFLFCLRVGDVLRLFELPPILLPAATKGLLLAGVFLEPA